MKHLKLLIVALVLVGIMLSKKVSANEHTHHNHGEEKLLVRFSVALDTAAVFSTTHSKNSIIQSADMGIHVGVNFLFPETDIEFSCFMGIDRSLLNPLVNPYGWAALMGIELTVPLWQRIRLAGLFNFSWGWFYETSVYSNSSTIWSPPVAISPQIGSEVVVAMWGTHNRSELSLQVTAGPNIGWGRGMWQVNVALIGAIHVNF